jgi:hypothetical protein
VCDTQLTFGSIFSKFFRSEFPKCGKLKVLLPCLSPTPRFESVALIPERCIGNPATISCLHTQLDVTRDIPRSICLHKLTQAFHRCPLNIVALQEIGWPKNCVSQKPQIDSCKIILPTFLLRSRIHSEFPLQELCKSSAPLSFSPCVSADSSNLDGRPGFKVCVCPSACDL